MGSDLPKIHIEWDEAHAAGLKPELRTYQQIVSRLGSHEGVETSLDTGNADECAWGREPSAAAGKDSPPIRSGSGGECNSLGGDECNSLGGDECDSLGGGILHDVRAMCRSLGRLRELGATVMIDGREANTATLDAYEDALAREVRQMEDEGLDNASYHGTASRERGGGFLSTIIYVVGLAVVLQWLFSCS